MTEISLSTTVGQGPGTLGLSILESEVTTLVTAMRRSNVWSRSDTTPAHPALLTPFLQLKSMLNSADNLTSKSYSGCHNLEPNIFLSPFLDVIRSEVVTGPVTGLALDAVHKMLSYELLHPEMKDIESAVENLADAVTHARFVGVDPSSDEVVLMKIIAVLRLLMLSPVGLTLTNESVCEIMQSTFRICFENRLSDLLRKTAEMALADMIQLLFTRLPTFSEDYLPLLKKLKMRSIGASEKSDKPKRSKSALSTSQKRQKGKREKSPNDKAKQENMASTIGNSGQKVNSEPTNENNTSAASDTASTYSKDNQESKSDATSLSTLPSPSTELPPETPVFNVDSDVLARSPIGSVSDLTSLDESNKQNIDTSKEINSVSESKNIHTNLAPEVNITMTTPEGCNAALNAKSEETISDKMPEAPIKEKSGSVEHSTTGLADEDGNFTNAQGVTFAQTVETVDEMGGFKAYGLPCVREVFRFLISLINPHESWTPPGGQGNVSNNSVGGITLQNDTMIQIALSLLSSALETGAEHIHKFESLLELVKDDLCKNLVALLSAERVSTFASALWISYIIIVTQRKHIKHQLEIFLMRLIDVVSSESQRITYEHKELVLEMIVRLYKIPGFVSQLFLNYDCDMYAQDVFEDLCKMLAKGALPLSGLYSTHLLSLDALLTIINGIENQCRKQSKDKSNDIKKSKMSDNENFKHSGDSTNQSLDDSAYSVASHEELLTVKQRKKIINVATSQFNTKPSKGVAYMQEMNLFQTPMDPFEVGNFMRENPHLDKKQIGEYVSNRKNIEVLEAFVTSFQFAGLRVDESLRVFLESFRLPGEAPLITLILEKFADHWQKCNDNQLADSDAAFTLAYAVIMLNVDQHNKNHTKTNEPMTPEQFMRNLRGTNGGGDHDKDMLAEIYSAIRNEEIVMPAEQTGIVKENYIWKCALKRSQEKDGLGGYLLYSNVMFDHDLFELIWGPTVAALAQVFDKTKIEEASLTTGTDMIEKSLQGFKRCAYIASEYRMTNVFDHIIISLSKFTTLQKASCQNSGTSIFSAQFGSDTKAQLATRMVFDLVHKYGDILRSGWKNVLDCLLQLFYCQLLPQTLLEAEDYLESTGRVMLFREQERDDVKIQSSFLDSLVSWMSTNDSVNSSGQRIKTPEEEESCQVAEKCIQDCNTELLITESKFLVLDSLNCLVDLLIEGSREDPDSQNQNAPNENLAAPTLNETSQVTLLENAAIFFEELIVRITIQNRDRVTSIWKKISEHILSLILDGTKSTIKKSKTHKDFILERSVTAILRLCVRLARREDLASLVVRSLDPLVRLKTTNMFKVSRHVAFGLHELLRNNAANIHEAEDWSTIFALIEIAGAGASPDLKTKEASNQGSAQGNAARHQRIQPQDAAGDDDSGHGASSDSESPTTSRTNSPTNTVGSSASGGGSHQRELITRERSGSLGSSTGGWIVLGGTNASAAEQQYQAISEGILVKFDKLSIVHCRKIVMHDSIAFLKSCESLAFLIRDVAHITPHNFVNCVLTLRTFVEASFMGRNENDLQKSDSKQSPARSQGRHISNRNKSMRRIRSVQNIAERASSRDRASSRAGSDNDAGDEEDLDNADVDDLSSEYHHVSLQLLDLMHTLHTRAAQIHYSWAEESQPTVENVKKIDEGGSQGNTKTLDDATNITASSLHSSTISINTTSQLWITAWCPLLQGMARLCCDRRSHIRTSALTTLQRSLLFHDLQKLSSSEWEAAFTSVLFPMLSHLLVKSKPGERTAMEETRTRAATLLGKVFLQHLTPLATLQTFTALWLTILDFMEKFIKAATSDLLADQIPESLKNMLLVMDTAGIFLSSQTMSNEKTTPLWELTWDKLDTFLPNLMPDLFGDRQRSNKQNLAPVALLTAPATEQSKVEIAEQKNENHSNQECVPQTAEKNEKIQIEEAVSNLSLDNTVVEAGPINLNDTIEENGRSMPSDTSDVEKTNLPACESMATQKITEPARNVPFALASSTLMKPDSSIPPPPIISPIEPPIRSASNFFPASPESASNEQVTSHSIESMSETIVAGGSTKIASPVITIPQPTIVNLPSRPNIAPMPPPPPGIMNTRTFQPIHPNVALTESPNTQPVTLVSPKPLHLPPPNQLPTPSINPQLASYFGPPALPTYGSGDIHSGIVGSFTSTPITSNPYPHPSNLTANMQETIEKPEQPKSCDDKPQEGQMYNV